MTRGERQKMRAKAIDDLMAGMSNEDVADKYGYSVSWVKTLRIMHSVNNPHSPRQGTLRVIAELLNTQDTQAQVAATCNTTRQQVHVILMRAKAAGIKFPHRETK